MYTLPCNKRTGSIKYPKVCVIIEKGEISQYILFIRLVARIHKRGVHKQNMIFILCN